VTHPRFNHVALSVPPTSLDDAGRADIIGFYSHVFGWQEMPTMTRPGEQLVLQAYSYDQFVFIIGRDEPMRGADRDHFGMAVDSIDELEGFLTRAREVAASDDRVEIEGPETDDFGFLKLHSFYVRFLLPMMLEVQHWEWEEGAAPQPAT
jgi:hypothetical protein